MLRYLCILLAAVLMNAAPAAAAPLDCSNYIDTAHPYSCNSPDSPEGVREFWDYTQRWGGG